MTILQKSTNATIRKKPAAKTAVQGRATNLFERYLLAAPIVVWFAYFPLWRLGNDTVMNFKLSFTLFYLITLALLGVPIAWRYRSTLIKNRSLWPVTGFVIISGLSLAWTASITKGFFTLGVIGLLYIILLACISRASQVKALLPRLAQIFIASAVLMSILSLVQIIAAIWLNRQDTLLCPGCVPMEFGFARPNVFTIEPQFLGNVLLAPALILFWLLMRNHRSKWALISFTIIITGLFLTLSRGAIFGFGVALIVLAVVSFNRIKTFLLPVSLMATSFVACLLLQASVAAVNPHLDISFSQAIRTSINQLSLGVIKLPSKQAPPVDTRSASPTPVQPVTPTASNDETTPVFDGYVAESTDKRLTLSSLTLKSWEHDPARMLFGVGLGGSGLTLHKEYPAQIDQREIVQNEYLEILLETGVLGAAFFLATLAILVYALRSQEHRWAWSIIAAFLAQWNFFSGYPNALHIYFVFIALAVLSIQPPVSKSSQRQASVTSRS